MGTLCSDSTGSRERAEQRGRTSALPPSYALLLRPGRLGMEAWCEQLTAWPVLGQHRSTQESTTAWEDVSIISMLRTLAETWEAWHASLVRAADSLAGGQTAAVDMKDALLTRQRSDCTDAIHAAPFLQYVKCHDVCNHMMELSEARGS